MIGHLPRIKERSDNKGEVKSTRYLTGISTVTDHCPPHPDLFSVTVMASNVLHDRGLPRKRIDDWPENDDNYRHSLSAHELPYSSSNWMNEGSGNMRGTSSQAEEGSQSHGIGRIYGRHRNFRRNSFWILAPFQPLKHLLKRVMNPIFMNIFLGVNTEIHLHEAPVVIVLLPLLRSLSPHIPSNPQGSTILHARYHPISIQSLPTVLMLAHRRLSTIGTSHHARIALTARSLDRILRLFLFRNPASLRATLPLLKGGLATHMQMEKPRNETRESLFTLRPSVLTVVTFRHHRLTLTTFLLFH
ncbi:hypothetical protein L218DRAFT_526082 [Marasmius fiardii PR-910]|nr:hypothetical protein L218DRAFT_526082 [Marasmius fiardii PR-910]